MLMLAVFKNMFELALVLSHLNSLAPSHSSVVTGQAPVTTTDLRAFPIKETELNCMS
jgi:hypothetical protein